MCEYTGFVHPADLITQHFRLAEPQKRALHKLGIHTIRDLLFHFPFRYDNYSDLRSIEGLQPNQEVVLYGTISKLKTRKAWKSRRPVAEGVLEDGTGKMKIIWFNQPYLAKYFSDGDLVKVSGKVTGTAAAPYLANPEMERAATPDRGLFQAESRNLKAESLLPVYPESRGVTSLWFYHALDRVLKSGVLETIEDPIPLDILERYHLPGLRSALIWIHTPKKESDAQAARKRFAFEEVFLIQLSKAQERMRYQEKKSFRVAADKHDVDEFVKRFPFEPTGAQRRAIAEILADFDPPAGGKRAMARLLEGDVGSGKTAVAAATAYAITVTHPLKRPKGTFGRSLPDGNDVAERQTYGNLQTAYMAPTEILAKQQFESFISCFRHMPINIGLITGAGCKKFPSKASPGKATDISRSQLLKWVANGEIPILIGTHALIQKSVQFKNLAYVIIDEQHRFGTAQRQKLARKDDIAPHLLSMTATPIPRTLALTIYGDLDLTLLDEMPAGRKPIITEIVTPEKRTSMYEKIRVELAAGRQAYVICPRIDEPDPTKELALQAKSVKEEAKRLKKEVFPEYEIEILHSKMSAKEKDAVMARFSEGTTHILAATSVVEVGVNVPNATVILIEGAERFGLAQLHQLRGRVLRSNHQAYCFALAETKGARSLERLRALKSAKNGFELAEFDLAQRGSGELYGRKQWGLSDIGMEALHNIKMVEAARNEAHALVRADPKLANYPLLAERVGAKTAELHFE